jgi:CheY-like chemotaxis protein
MSTASPMVLIVEDEEGIRESLRDLLEDEGYEVAVACDGRDAVEQLLQRAPALVILDLLLPYLTGNEVYNIMQRSPGLERIPVLVTTSDPTAAPLGLPVLEKPLNFKDLLHMVSLCARGVDDGHTPHPRCR